MQIKLLCQPKFHQIKNKQKCKNKSLKIIIKKNWQTSLQTLSQRIIENKNIN